MSAELDSKVSILNEATIANTASTTTAVELIVKLRADLAAGSVDSPATLQTLDAITATLQGNTQALTGA